MKKLIIITLCISLLLIVSCQNSYETCKQDCANLCMERTNSSYERPPITKTSIYELATPECKEECYDECRGTK